MQGIQHNIKSAWESKILMPDYWKIFVVLNWKVLALKGKKSLLQRGWFLGCNESCTDDLCHIIFLNISNSHFNISWWISCYELSLLFWEFFNSSWRQGSTSRTELCNLLFFLVYLFQTVMCFYDSAMTELFK